MDKYYIYLQFLSLFLTYAFIVNIVEKNKIKIKQRILNTVIYFFIIGLAISYPYYRDYKIQYFFLAACYPLIACIGLYRIEFKS